MFFKMFIVYKEVAETIYSHNRFATPNNVRSLDRNMLFVTGSSMVVSAGQYCSLFLAIV